MDRFQDAKLRIKERTDLAQLVQGYVALTRRGRYFVGLCPFHREKTPSFTVFPDTQHYKCFGCGVAGDVFTFVTQREGLSFREAFELLAERAGVPTEGVFGTGASKGGPRRDEVHDVLGQVRDFFEEQLFADAGVAHREYLERRGLLVRAAVEDFGLGAHPEGGRLGAFAKDRKLSGEVLEQAGLLLRDGREPLAGRVTFAITAERGRLVGFGGRVLPDPSYKKGEDPRAKYRNSPESPFFNKRGLLYGLKQVKRAGTRRIVVVEGYVDVIACHLAGFTGAVATLGTSFTTQHARLLELFATEGVVLLFDGDTAGRRAADRAFRELVQTRLPVRVALLPEGRDPDDLAAIAPGIEQAVAEQRRAELASIIDRADDLLGAWFGLKRRDSDLGDSAVVAKLATECGRILAEVEDRARRESLRSEMARQLGISEAAIVVPAQRKTAAAEDAPQPVAAVEPVRRSPQDHADLELLGCVLAAPELLEEAVGLPGDRSPSFQRVIDGVTQARRAGAGDREALLKDLFARFTDESRLLDFLHEASERSARIRDPRDMFLRLRRDRDIHFAREQARRTLQQVKQAIADGDSARADELTRKYQDLLRRSHAAADG
ncbi:MAG: DNA primase [Planctomycetes bacterium]|nr:DNA primase [Planctomycetota bacterium]